MEDFYITLPSSVKSTQFENTSSRYVTRLPEVLHLEKDKYSVAVTDIIYPYSFLNVGRPLDYWIHFKPQANRPPIHVTFPANQYVDVDQVVKTLNDEHSGRLKRSAADAQLEHEISRAKRAAVVQPLTFPMGDSSIRDQFNKAKAKHEAEGGAIISGFNAAKSENDSKVKETDAAVSQHNTVVSANHSGRVVDEYNRAKDQTEKKSDNIRKEFEKLKSDNEAKVKEGDAVVSQYNSAKEAQELKEKEEAEKRKEESDAEAKRVIETTKKLEQEAKLKKKADEDAKLVAEQKAQEDKKKADEAKKKADDAKKKSEDAKKAQEEKNKADDEARQVIETTKRLEQEAKLKKKADEDAKLVAEQKAQEDKKKADDAKKAQEDKKKADDEARQVIETTKRLEQEAKLKQKADEDAKLAAEKKVQEDKQKADDEARRVIETTKRLEQEAKDQYEQAKSQSENRKTTNAKNTIEGWNRAHDFSISNVENFPEYMETVLQIMVNYKNKQIVEEWKGRLVKSRSKIYTEKALNSHGYLQFRGNEDRIHIDFLRDDIAFVEFEDACGYFLGFHNSFVLESGAAPSKIDLFGNVSTLYLYCDIVDPIIVGDQKNSLLAVIPCSGKYGEMIHHTIPQPRYLPIMSNTIDSIKVELLSEFAKPIQFNWGSSIIVLHFKKTLNMFYSK